VNTRSIQPEILDSLPVDDPGAMQSRRDLQKVSAFMGHVGVVARALRAAATPQRLIVELGAGDGSLLLKVARRLGPRPGTRAVFVDRLPSVTQATRREFEDAGWTIDVREADVFEWLSRPDSESSDAMIANLFLHHFRDDQLVHLLNLAAQQTRRFIACEPLRSRTALAGVSLLRLIGCNDITLHDGNLSVRAGFRDRELSRLWPRDSAWQIAEGRRGLFTHGFIAARPQPPTAAAPASRESRTSA
jgi:hypothetical protein